tara:strand:- start:202 stop:696 length:495 start_codon:yes stop_codon:yes gene_type:complete
LFRFKPTTKQTRGECCWIFFSPSLSRSVKSAQEKPLFDQILEFFNLRNEEEKKGSFGETTPTTQQKSFALLRNNTQRERERERLLSDLTFTDSFIKRLHSSGPLLSCKQHSIIDHGETANAEGVWCCQGDRLLGASRKIPEWKKGKAVRESHLKKKDPNLRRCL